MMKYQFSISSNSVAGIPQIVIEGDLTSDAGSDLKNVYNELKKTFAMDKIVVNFDKCKYINSSGIASLISIIQQTNDNSGITCFVGLSEHLNKVMDIVGLTDFVQIYKNNEEAVSALG